MRIISFLKNLSLFTKISLILLVVLIIVYQLRVKPKNFFELYKKNDEAALNLKKLYAQPVKKIKVNSVQWTYYTTGNPQNKAILFLHGMGGAYDLWWQQIAALKKDYFVLSYTLPASIDNLQDAAAGIKAILEKEKVKNFSAVGTSMGGYITQYLLKTMPERLDKVVFGNTFPPNDKLLKDNLTKSKIIPYLPEVVIGWFGQKSLKNKLFPGGHNDPLLKAFLPSLPFSKKSFINRFRVVVDKFMINPAQYKYKRVPKLIIESDNDPLIPPELRQEIKNLYPDAEVYTFHNEGHFPYINAAKTYNQVIENFLKQENEIPKMEETIRLYFEGRRQADTILLRQAFSKNALLMSADKVGEQFIPVNDYLQMVAKSGPQKVKTNIIDFDKSDQMAVFKTKFAYPDKTYVDYLNLKKSGNQWQIFLKTFEQIK